MKADHCIDFIVEPGGPLSGELQVPGDKSISHRALMLAAIAEGDTRITGFLDSEDTMATLHAFREMGVAIEQAERNEIIVNGAGLYGLTAPESPLDLGNSGTSVRLLAGLLAGQRFDCELRGDMSLMQRPMRRVTDPLAQMGAEISCTEQGTLPVRICGGHSLRGISYAIPVASAQLKSALLLAGLYASGQTCVQEPVVTRDHTERMLAYFGCPTERSGNRICISSRPLTARRIDIPADLSSAAFFMVAASIVEGSDLLLTGVGINPTRHAVIEILKSMGAGIRVENEAECCGEPIADIRIRYSRLQGVRIPPHLVPVAIDEFPAILIAAACARGETQLSGAAELRVKESDRIKAMADGLTELGITVNTTADGMLVQGGRCSGGIVDSYSDHRIAMAFAVAGITASGPVTIRNCANVNTSFPGFIERVRGLDITINMQESNYD